MRTPMRMRGVIAALGAACLMLVGCADGGRRDIPPEPKPKPLSNPNYILNDTIGAYTLIGMGQPERLRGFGIVIGLGENGGSDCPSGIRDYLLDYLAREFAPRDVAGMRPSYTAKEMLDSLDTAVVSVHGLVPVGAPKGSRFDVQIEAVGTQARSLEGGVLVLCEMKRFNVDAEGKGLVSGHPLARARGLVYTSAAAGDDPELEQERLRRGIVLGGGKTLEVRNVRLMLQEPSYALARKIERRINERFGQEPPVADAVSRGYLTLTTPEEYADDPKAFLDLVTHLYLESTPGQVDRKIELLSRELDGTDETLNHISLIWEGLGRTVIPRIQSLYTHGSPSVRFYAARAGLRLKDVDALSPMGRIAADPDQHYRLPAIHELGQCDLPQASHRLAELLDDLDDEVRVAAYEGLLRHPHSRVETRRYLSGADPTQFNLTLDVVQSSGPPLIYARCTDESRIAVFGRDTAITLPIFYNQADDAVTLNALENQEDITLLWRSPSGKLSTEPLRVPPRVVALIETLAQPAIKDKKAGQLGVGLGYSRILDLLDTLCANHSIPAKFVMETPPTSELLGPLERPERPETDSVASPPAEEPKPDLDPETQTEEQSPATESEATWERTE